MLTIKKKRKHQYLYLVPMEDGLAKWEILEQEELEQRADDNQLEENARVFKLDQEVSLRFEKITHLEL